MDISAQDILDYQSSLSDLVELMVAQGNLPQYLYRFRSFNQYSDDIIENNRLWFANPQEFNDPFDCQIKIDTDNSYDEIYEFLINNAYPVLDKNRIQELAAHYFDNKLELHALVNSSKANNLSKMGICCFSSEWNSVLMWSHYTTSHQGFVLKFDVLEDCDFFITPFNVKYKTDYPVYNHIRNPNELVEKLIITKHDSWSYEKEIRIHKLKSGNHEFDKATLKEIIFGANSTQKDIDRMKQLVVASGYRDVIFSKAKIDDKQFSLSKDII